VIKDDIYTENDSYTKDAKSLASALYVAGYHCYWSQKDFIWKDTPDKSLWELKDYIKQRWDDETLSFPWLIAGKILLSLMP